VRPQDVVAGDGTTSVVVICGALLKKVTRAVVDCAGHDAAPPSLRSGGR
jgi:chaperonin GroEL (HSP60 family)